MYRRRLNNIPRFSVFVCNSVLMQTSVFCEILFMVSLVVSIYINYNAENQFVKNIVIGRPINK